MKRKYDVLRFALKCLLIPAAAVLIIYCLNKPYRKINEANYQDILKFSALGHNYSYITVGNLGSSHGMYDFNYKPLTDRGYECFNFANTSQSYDYDYAVLKEYVQYMVDDSIMLIPVSYFSFNNEVVNETEAEAMSLRYYHFLSPENIPDYDPYIDITTNKLPILTAGKDIVKLFPSLKLSIVALAAEDNGIDMEEFTRRAAERYSRHFDNKEEYFLPERIQNLYDIINYCKEHDITPILITPPFSKYYQDLVPETFLQEFQETINTIVSDTGVEYYDYSYDDRFRGNVEYFMDADHLSKDGALYFMEILLDEIPKLHWLIS
ncbi:MAG: D-alanyl-lipoteichoic acid biosynthesis protein DltD [Bacillus sp. (in: Bacteria)]|nr:D-alanyl-lipoteichoic acid biosynthesis protein DltD [Bacillus sp. (in: firmicutes)]MCM1426152.1 D-alanyl-lipoteichoic acid biosynthesis protein DltD [Eubacterium sp.]